MPALNNFEKLTGKRLCQSLFLNTVASLSLLKTDSGTRVFLQILQHFQEHLLCKTHTHDCF